MFLRIPINEKTLRVLVGGNLADAQTKAQHERGMYDNECAADGRLFAEQCPVCDFIVGRT